MKNNLTTGETSEKQWTEVMERHRAAVANYLQIASEINAVNWRIPVEVEKWTPAQITEHLILTYQVFVKQIGGEQNIEMVYGFLLRRVLRLVVLTKIFRTRRFPRGAKAPKEILPTESNQTLEAALKQLEESAGEFEMTASAHRNEKNLRLTHHVFGEIKLLEAVDLAAIHTEHHTRQLPQG